MKISQKENIPSRGIVSAADYEVLENIPERF
jgi:hypothetical protein